jgi:hypothetical protein
MLSLKPIPFGPARVVIIGFLQCGFEVFDVRLKPQGVLGLTVSNESTDYPTCGSAWNNPQGDQTQKLSSIRAVEKIGTKE